ncbi:hypothetical protein HNY73_004172 [Argiope bruennichi]|uniref:Uncharacterized protein n=1 Tax=Argiope bruennichi TaxID=94029 RepID=A0A8T0FQZ2_ARGBR|nr:hypothetical protein HNY73_004172 [Argiope bruennichi]
MTTIFGTVCLKTSSQIFLFKNHFQRILSFEKIISFRTLRSAIENCIAKYGTAYNILNRGIVLNSEVADISPGAASVMQPRLKPEEDDRPPEVPLIQLRRVTDEQHESYRLSKAPVIQPNLAPNELRKSYRPYEAFLAQPKLIYRAQLEFYRPSETSVIQPKIAPDEMQKRPSGNMQPLILSEKPIRSSETLVIQSLLDHRNFQKQSETSSTQSRTLQFESKLKDIGCQVKIEKKSGVDASKREAGCFISSGMSMTVRGRRKKYVRKVTEKFESQTEDQVKYKDFSQQVDFNRKRRRISKLRNNLAKHSI